MHSLCTVVKMFEMFCFLPQGLLFAIWSTSHVWYYYIYDCVRALFMAGVQNKELKLLIPRKWALCLFHSDTYNYFYFLPLPWCHTINSPWTKSIWYLIVLYLWLTNSQRNIRNKIKGFAPCLLYCSDTHEHHYQQLLRVVTKLNHVRCGKDWTKSHFTTWKSLQKT